MTEVYDVVVSIRKHNARGVFLERVQIVKETLLQ